MPSLNASRAPVRSLRSLLHCYPVCQQVRDEQAEAQSVAAAVSAEEAAVAAKAAQCKALKDDAAAELVGVGAFDAMPSGQKPACGMFSKGYMLCKYVLPPWGRHPHVLA